MKNNRGFVQLLVILVLVVIIISLLGVSLGDIPEKNTLKENFGYVWDGIEYVWENFIYPYAGTIWEKAREYIWEPILRTANKIRQ
ncbi:hypothetical protein A3B18_03845 [Candidatus Giovannonibacteria bacterium RIFCSPLOWO2_01_FULL_46_13]|uniref:Uncharacterized protein n=1 Tax=Candidatus Giovannonibacteria bacterium RIFCSPLOWO2_01_FULL_46_13 TaxID=1798352 RepID=A0A1F5X2X7_9BACT|nr:MAG: hypothetical protein A3B18_03845 [Candidatus Giovannonibacteria bacterium RIFCSPLOWO2_01_FULL_46_13]